MKWGWPRHKAIFEDHLFHVVVKFLHQGLTFSSIVPRVRLVRNCHNSWSHVGKLYPTFGLEKATLAGHGTLERQRKGGWLFQTLLHVLLPKEAACQSFENRRSRFFGPPRWLPDKKEECHA